MDTMRKYCKDELPKGCPDCQKEDAFGDVCHAYQAYEQGKADATRWIPVNERLPKEYEHVLVYTSKGFITTGVCWEYSPFWEYVIAWMPLPEPYREGKKE